MQITLSSEEQQLLTKVLEERHRELLREISRTHHHEFKIVLQNNAKLLESMVDKLKKEAPLAA
jgi:endo-alpha-1,4-polygalactosaminidase (GH114 family)